MKRETDIDTLKFAKKVVLARLRSDVDELDINKFKTVPINLKNLQSRTDKLNVNRLESVPTDLKKLSDVFNKDVMKKSE